MLNKLIVNCKNKYIIYNLVVKLIVTSYIIIYSFLHLIKVKKNNQKDSTI